MFERVVRTSVLCCVLKAAHSADITCEEIQPTPHTLLRGISTCTPRSQSQRTTRLQTDMTQEKHLLCQWKDSVSVTDFHKYIEPSGHFDVNLNKVLFYHSCIFEDKC